MSSSQRFTCSAVFVLVFSLLALLISIAWIFVLAIMVDWERLVHLRVDFEASAVEKEYWQWIFTSPVLVIVVAIFGIAAAALLLRKSSDRTIARQLLAVFLMLGVMLMILAAALYGAWMFYSHLAYVLGSNVLEVLGCKDDFTLVPCGPEDDVNPLWVSYQFLEAHRALLGLGITAILLQMIGLAMAAFIFCYPLSGSSSKSSRNRGSRYERRETRRDYNRPEPIKRRY